MGKRPGRRKRSLSRRSRQTGDGAQRCQNLNPEPCRVQPQRTRRRSREAEGKLMRMTKLRSCCLRQQHQMDHVGCDFGVAAEGTCLCLCGHRLTVGFLATELAAVGRTKTPVAAAAATR